MDILGTPVGEVVTPQDLAEAEAIMRERHARGSSVAFLGGGTELGYGYPPARVDTLVCTQRLARVVEYAPADMVVTVEAGLPLAELQRALAPHRQRLALDPPQADKATIGGLLATGAYGPRRARYGSLRDLIVGISIVRADGARARGGGKVVKNVAGFDVPKLMVNSLGTLGLIATATFRLHPLPETARWLRIGPCAAELVRTIVTEIVARQLEPTAYVAERAYGGYVLHVLFEGFAIGVDEQLDALGTLAAKLAVDAQSGGEESEAGVVQLEQSARARGEVCVRVSAPPAAFVRIDHEVIAPLQRALAGSTVVAYPSLGVTFLAGDVADAGALVEALHAARSTVEGVGGNLVLTQVGEDVAAQVDRFGTLPPSFEIMRRLKERFDPEGRLNPGRFLGGL